ncbi:hypothetical protein MTR67_001493 [Solanum verrucosum]|uniref:Integrase catalytic domain-containing protein n=1 Tax=Solanum verrucosum TaxID=315347 RepID=A0AAF0T8H2_SOLVR|nr:hypothetical protein MTR67_001493 [Solanum verrucosum]
MKRDITAMVVECPNCQQVKAEHQRPGGLTRCIELPLWKWDMINIDFITGLPHTPQRYDSIWKGLGTQVNLSTAFHPQTDGPAERTIQTIEDMLYACVLDFKGSRDQHLALIEFTYNNNFQASIQMAPNEALCGRKCRSPIGWFELGEANFLGPNLVQQAIEKCRQKSYADVRRWKLESDVEDWVCLKVLPMKGIMRFGKKGKLSPRYVEP